MFNNESVPMTRRYPKLPNKVLKRDSDIVMKIMVAWDKEHDAEKVFSIFLKECKNLSDERYWELLRTVWILAGSVERSATFRQLMKSNRKERYYFSTPEEAKELREMPETFEVYRATNSESDGGLSWTTSPDYVSYYAQTFNKSRLIAREVCRKEVFAYINRNKEYEIIIL